MWPCKLLSKVTAPSIGGIWLDFLDAITGLWWAFMNNYREKSTFLMMPGSSH